jgi:peptidoglycan/xylan/chitin deacetylase (PgdA/CDA1 family)
LILGYHGVSLADEHRWSDLYISEEHLRRRLGLLQRDAYAVLPFAEAVTRLYSGTLPRKSVALTFDDGGHDFFVKAYPILKEFGYHATLYLTTYYCQFQRPVFDTVCSYLLWWGQGRRVEFPDGFAGLSGLVPTKKSHRLELHQRVLARVREARFDATQKDAFARMIARQIGFNYDELLEKRLLHLMNRAEIEALDPEVVGVQLHTHRHRTPDDETLFHREIRDNRQAIESMIGEGFDRKHFCYPSGRHGPDLMKWLESARVVTATTCDPQIASPDSHALLLPRLIDTMDIPEVVFENWLSGCAAFLPQRRNYSRNAG